MYNYSPRKSLAFVPHKSDHNVLKYQQYVNEVSLMAHIRTIHLKERDGSGLICKGRHLNCLLFHLCFIADGKKIYLCVVRTFTVRCNLILVGRLSETFQLYELEK